MRYIIITFVLFFIYFTTYAVGQTTSTRKKEGHSKTKSSESVSKKQIISNRNFDLKIESEKQEASDRSSKRESTGIIVTNPSGSGSGTGGSQGIRGPGGKSNKQSSQLISQLTG